MRWTEKREVKKCRDDYALVFEVSSWNRSENET